MTKFYAGGQEFLSFDDVLLVESYTEVESRSNGDLSDAFPPLEVPVIASCMDTITGHKMLEKMDELGAMGMLHRYMEPEESLLILQEANLKGPKCSAIGLVRKDYKRINLLLDNIKDNLWLCVDVAHGHNPYTADTVKYIKDRRPDVKVISGNVSTPEGVEYLWKAGADAVRVGIGGGSVCKTRVKTGVGLPTFGSVLHCFEGTRSLDVHILACGGVRTPGDAALAIAAGASGVVVGGMFAGTDCTPIWTQPGDETVYRGMASKAARKAFGKRAIMAEGVSRQVICKEVGSTEEVVIEIEEGIRSAMSYIGAVNITRFRQNAQFARISNSTVKENVPHFSNQA